MRLTNEQKKFLLNLAIESIKSYFDNGTLKINEEELSEDLKKVSATFVTLTINGNLRGCIGKLQAVQPLFKDVIENVKSAAFQDPRFPPLSRDELNKIKIEISVLSENKKLNYIDGKDLINKLQKDKPGVVIKKDFYSATFLPQVWEDLPKAEEFLSHLCLKAGLSPDTWQKEKIKVYTYTVVKFSEK